MKPNIRSFLRLSNDPKQSGITQIIVTDPDCEDLQWDWPNGDERVVDSVVTKVYADGRSTQWVFPVRLSTLRGECEEIPLPDNWPCLEFIIRGTAQLLRTAEERAASRRSPRRDIPAYLESEACPAGV